MLDSPDKLSPQEIGLPDPTHAGNLVFGSFCDTSKLVNILSKGIKPRNGKPEQSSYYPNVVSLSAVGNKGYADTSGISMGWYTIIQNAKRFGSIDVENSFCYSFILDPDWIAGNINKFVGVGEALRDKEFSQMFKVGPLTDLQVDTSNTYDGAFFEEVHFKDGVIPPEALRGILIDEKISDFMKAETNLRKAMDEMNKTETKIKFPLGIYDQSGNLVELMG